MVDTIKVGLGDNAEEIALQSKPHPTQTDRVIIESPDGTPLRGRLSLKDHAADVKLPPNSFITIDPDAQARWIYGNHSSNDGVIFVLPSDNPSEFRFDQFLGDRVNTNTADNVLLLRRESDNAIVSGVIYRGRNIETIPEPQFVTPDGRPVTVQHKAVSERGDWMEIVGPHDTSYVYEASYQPVVAQKVTINPADIQNMTQEQRAALQNALDSVAKKDSVTYTAEEEPTRPNTFAGLTEAKLQR